MYFSVTRDDRGLCSLDIEHLRENKASLEADSIAILEGRTEIKHGKNEPTEFRPELPDYLRGALLHGMTRIEDRPSETKEQCLSRHKALKRNNIIAQDAPIRWFNPETREMEILNAD